MPEFKVRLARTLQQRQTKIVVVEAANEEDAIQHAQDQDDGLAGPGWEDEGGAVDWEWDQCYGVPPLVPTVGTLFRSKRDELDQDENDEERITPAGSVWEVRAVCDTYVAIVCKATGGWINPDFAELARDFEPLEAS